jgi:proline dehydrogenase
MEDGTRWTQPDLASALDWAEERNDKGISCILAPHGEYATTVEMAQNALDDLVCCSRRIFERGLDSSLGVKLTTLGAMFDRQLCRDYLVVLFEDALENGVNIEIDMETIPFVDYTMEVISSCLADYPLTISLQSYLERTRQDIDTALKRNGTVRLVKGAYSGDYSGFEEIRARFMELAEILMFSKGGFKVATHDPIIIDWLRGATSDKKQLVEFQFLKGLANETKDSLSEEGWRVTEYVPYGPGGDGYEARRLSYLRMLDDLELSPVP